MESGLLAVLGVSRKIHFEKLLLFQKPQYDLGKSLLLDNY